MTNDDVRTYRLAFKNCQVVLSLDLCPDCIRERLNAEASILNKSRPRTPAPCSDCQARKGRLR